MHMSVDGFISGKDGALDWPVGPRSQSLYGARIAQTLAKLNLIDEYQFKLEPVVVGSGSRLFENMKDRIKLKLIKSKEFACGVIGLYYQPIK